MGAFQPDILAMLTGKQAALCSLSLRTPFSSTFSRACKQS